MGSLNKKKDYKKIAKNVIDLEIKALKKLKDSINNSFNSAVETITKCQSKVILCGVGKSGIIASKISATLSSIGIPSFSLSANDCSHGATGLKLLLSKKLGLLIVRNNIGNTTGIFTDGDMKRLIAKNKKFYNLKLKEIMNNNPISINKDALTAKAISIMSEKKITSLCVHKSTKVKKTIGILHIHNILETNIK